MRTWGISVTTGWVGFEWRGRESFIPAGAVCLTRKSLGPGTPYLRRHVAGVPDGARDDRSAGRHAGRRESRGARSRSVRGAHEGHRHVVASALARGQRRSRPRVRSARRVRAAAGRRHARGRPRRPEADARRLVGHARPRRRELVAGVEAAVAGSNKVRSQKFEGRSKSKVREDAGCGGNHDQGSSQTCGLAVRWRCGGVVWRARPLHARGQSPTVLMFYGGDLKAPVFLTDADTAAFTNLLTDASITVKELGDRPFVSGGAVLGQPFGSGQQRHTGQRSETCNGVAARPFVSAGARQTRRAPGHAF